MSLAPTFVQSVSMSFPRVSGDEPRPDTGEDYGTRFSPRERG